MASSPRTSTSRVAWFVLAAIAVVVALSRVGTSTAPVEDGATESAVAAPAGHAVFLKEGGWIECDEAPVIAFGRVLFERADGKKQALAQDLVDVERTRAHSRDVGAAEAAVAARQPQAKPSLSVAASPKATVAKATPTVSSQRAMAPDFEAIAADGSKVKLSDLRGKVVLVDFWASWCGPCRREMPQIKALHAEMAGEEFQIVGVSLDRQRAAFEKYVDDQDLVWPHSFDGQGWSNGVARAYGVRTIPQAVLVDRDGRIAHPRLRAPQAREKVRELLGGTG